MATLTSYPLAWPKDFPRTKWPEPGRFRTSFAAALKNVEDSLKLFAHDSQRDLRGVVISSNRTLKDRYPEDAGAAIWFQWDGLQVSIPIDRYNTVEANLQAIHKILEAKRIELRHGTLEIVRAGFKGFLLAAPTGRRWWEVLGVSEHASEEEKRDAYRRLASAHHPDKGGSAEAMAEINAAWERARDAQSHTHAIYERRTANPKV